MEFTGPSSALHMSLPEAGYGSEEGYVGSEISGAVSGVTTPGASRLQASQSQQRSTTMQRLQRCSPRLGGTLVCAAQHLKRYHDPEDLCGEEWELNDEEIAALDLQGAASPMEVEGELPDMNAEEMAKEGFYLVKSVLRHRYRQGWRFLTLWEGFGVEEATWEPFSAFVLPEGRLNSVLVDYLSQNNLGELLRLAETLASKNKARD